MKSAVLSISILCGLAATSAMAQDATAYGGGVKCAPTDAPQLGSAHVFTRDGSDLSDAGEYPRAAKINTIEGQAAVDCQIGQDGYLTQCVVASESQPGYDLGRGLAVTVLKWAQTDTSRPDHQAGNWLRFTTNWKLPPAQVATAEASR